MPEAIRACDVERADVLAHAHIRQFHDSFLDFLKENHSRNVSLQVPGAAA